MSSTVFFHVKQRNFVLAVYLVNGSSVSVMSVPLVYLLPLGNGENEQLVPKTVESTGKDTENL